MILLQTAITLPRKMSLNGDIVPDDFFSSHMLVSTAALLPYHAMQYPQTVTSFRTTFCSRCFLAFTAVTTVPCKISLDDAIIPDGFFQQSHTMVLPPCHAIPAKSSLASSFWGPVEVIPVTGNFFPRVITCITDRPTDRPTLLLFWQAVPLVQPRTRCSMHTLRSITHSDSPLVLAIDSLVLKVTTRSMHTLRLRSITDSPVVLASDALVLKLTTRSIHNTSEQSIADSPVGSGGL